MEKGDSGMSVNAVSAMPRSLHPKQINQFGHPLQHRTSTDPSLVLLIFALAHVYQIKPLQAVALEQPLGEWVVRLHLAAARDGQA